jgi:chromosome segregation ATPase
MAPVYALQIETELTRLLVDAPPVAMMFMLAGGLLAVAWFALKHFLPLVVQITAAFTALSKSVDVLNSVVTKSITDGQATAQQTFEAITNLGDQQDAFLGTITKKVDDTIGRLNSVEEQTKRAADAVIEASKNNRLDGDQMQTIATDIATKITGGTTAMENTQKALMDTLARFQESVATLTSKLEVDMAQITQSIAELQDAQKASSEKVAVLKQQLDALNAANKSKEGEL